MSPDTRLRLGIAGISGLILLLPSVVKTPKDDEIDGSFGGCLAACISILLFLAALGCIAYAVAAPPEAAP